MKEAAITRVQLAVDGRVWYAHGHDTPQMVTPDRDLVCELTAKPVFHVRALGTALNAPLIVALHRVCQSDPSRFQLEVASPAVCENQRELCDPQIALYRMRQCQLPASLGGWHKFGPLDYVPYAIAANDRQDWPAQKLVETHPAYRDLTFIRTLDQGCLAALLATILDPRWFVDVKNPYRLSRLKQYLGLRPRYMHKVLSGNLDCEWSRRCALTLTAWGGQGKVPTNADYERPGNFLWRRFRASDGGVKGSLRATQAFITYLIRTWQGRLFANASQHLQMFTPQELLQGSEVAAYKAHIATTDP